MAGWVLALALLQAAAPAPQVHSAPLAGSLPPLDAIDDHRPGPFRQRGPLFISPMGEPFRGADPIGLWFDHADANHDGVVTLAEFLADADRFFVVLDRQHDGEIDPDDIEYYETELVPEIRTGGGTFARSGGRGAGGGGGRRGGRGGGGRRGGGGPDGSESAGEGGQSDGAEQSSAAIGTYDAVAQGAARFGFFGFPEPVTSADANLNRGVDIREFRGAAQHRFALLDTRNDGKVTRDELPKLALAPGGPGGGRPGWHGGRRGGPGRAMPQPQDPGE